MEPNLFNYATSELSQDAFLLWLLEWAKPENKPFDIELHSASQNFLRFLMGKDASYEICSVVCNKQWNHIDVFALVNDSVALIIEDKILTNEHSNQIERYRTMVNNYYAGKDIEVCSVYLKTGNESFNLLRKKCPSVKIVGRKDLMNLLQNSGSKNIILRDFIQHLQELDDKTDAFRNKAFEEWRGNPFAWQGFYMMLEEKYLHDAGWGYVSNRNGGFWGLWWHWVGKEDYSLKLQFEQSKLCVKLAFDMNSSKSIEIARSTRNKIFEKVKRENIEGLLFPKLKLGENMTIAYFSESSVFGQGIVDMETLVGKLLKIKKILDEL